MATEPTKPNFPELAAEIHLANEVLLREAVDYLMRLPFHPMTRGLATKIQSQLDDPLGILVREDDKRLTEARRTDLLARRGSSRFTPAGLPVILVTVEGGIARVSSPVAKSLGSSTEGQRFAANLASELADGISVELGPRHGYAPIETALSDNADQKAELMTLLLRLLEQSGDADLLAEVSIWLDEWLTSPLPDLGGISPAKAMRSEAGRRQVKSLLERMHGGHSD